MSVILMLTSDAISRTRLRGAVKLACASRIRHQIVEVDTWSEAESRAAEAVAHVLVFDPFRPTTSTFTQPWSFHERFPSTALLPYATFQDRCPNEVLRLATLGVETVVTLGKDDSPSALLAHLESTIMRGVVGIVLAALEGAVPHDLLRLLRGCVSCTYVRLAPNVVAKLAHCHPDTLRKQLRAARLPSVNKLIIWTRLFQAGHLLGDHGRSVASVAYALDFTSPSALRNQFMRYAAMTPCAVRTSGGATVLLTRFLERQRIDSWA